MKQTDVENRFRQMERPEPPPSLRDRVLSEATIVGPPVTWSDRMWYSRTWRVSMAAAALFFLSLNIVPGAQRSADMAPTAQMAAATRAIEDIGQQIGLPALAGSLAWRAKTGFSTRELDRYAVLAALDGEQR